MKEEEIKYDAVDKTSPEGHREVLYLLISIHH